MHQVGPHPNFHLRFMRVSISFATWQRLHIVRIGTIPCGLEEVEWESPLTYSCSRRSELEARIVPFGPVADLVLAGCVGELVAGDPAISPAFLEAFLSGRKGESRETQG